MKKRWKGRFVIVLTVVCTSIYLIFPLKGKIKLGLDLKGGIHLVLQVNAEDAIDIETDEQISRLQQLLKKDDIEFRTLSKAQPGRFFIQGINTGQYVEVKRLLKEYERDWDVSLDGETATFSMKDALISYLKDQAVDQTLETIRNRIDEFGVSEPTIQRQGIGGDQIIIELPGVDNPERVKNIIKTTALLEWKLVKAGPAPSQEELLDVYGGSVPIDMEIVMGDPERTETGYFLVNRVAAVAGKDLVNARLSLDEWNSPVVAFSLNAAGAGRFRVVTSENIGKPLAIILDGKVQSAPIIEDEIYDSGIIRGNFSTTEAEDLALVLRAGALPASIKYLEERTIGPSLGADSIRRGLQACLVALFLVMLFMVSYYRSAGINADTALVLNMILLLGALSAFKATLTLPGIAGIILSMGMAVDANVLIFERIREELTLAKSMASSIAIGFKRAFSAILDSNLTTIIAAIFLFQFGTGPIRGYAVTLIIGITASMFTAVFVSRLIFDMAARRRIRGEKKTKFLKSSLFKKTDIPFLRYKFFAFALSAIVILAGLVNVTVGKGLKYGVDFIGGTLIRVEFNDPIQIDEIRQALKSINLAKSSIQEVGKGGTEYLIRTTLIQEKLNQEELEAHEIIGSKIVTALREEEDKLNLERGIQDLNSLSEGDLEALLRTDFPDKASEIAGQILRTRINLGIIKDYSQLQKEGISEDVLSSLKERTFLSRLTVLSKETVGPQVGKQMRIKATQATAWALIGMLVYIALRFKLSYGVSAVLTLTHDVLVTLSILSFTGREINLPVIAAILTIVGFSLNDTIVIFDRVRDNLKKMRGSDFVDILNASVNQTLSRSIITSGTVFLTVIALYFLGGEVINDFAFTMLIGIISGSYSTIYQSCPIVYFWQKIFKTKHGV